MKVLLIASLLALAAAAHAEEDPKPGRLDARMRVIAYNPNQVVHLSTAAGATLVVRFAPDENVTQVAVTDSKDLKAQPARNFLFLKSQAPLTLQPVVVLTETPQGRLRRYVFEVAMLEPGRLGAEAPDIYYSVEFTYPADAAAAKRAQDLADARKLAEEARKAATAAEARAAADELKLAQATMEREARDPDAGLRNWKYLAQGDRSLLPLEIFDTGFSTVFRFPGNTRVPALFVINPDGKEATPNYAVKGELVEVDSTARQWRLRDGDTVLCVWNRAFDPAGRNPGTGTTSPDVIRQTEESPQ